MGSPSKLSAVVGERLLASPWLRRLGRISFLGTLDYHPQSQRSTSRLDHSLGVAELGRRLCADLEVPAELTRPFVAACLLHDIGHFPLSHAAEPGFARALGVAHHEVSEWIIRGNGAIPTARSLRPDLEAAGIDPELCWGLITGECDDPRLRPLADVMKAPINLDTLEGIVRAARSFKIRALRLPPRLFAGHGGEVWLRPEALPVIDRFWTLKDRVYGEVITLPSNILCEAGLSSAVAERFGPAIFAAFDRFDDAALAPLVADQVARSGLDRGDDERFAFLPRSDHDALLRRARKRYYVDRGALADEPGLPLRRWSERYRHERQVMVLVPRRPSDQLTLPGFDRSLAAVEAPEL
ncbi:MAG: HD domain-containing protein [Myxococcales bacterium]|nr:HD domain-containing protein [Myxococcales bacterium]